MIRAAITLCAIALCACGSDKGRMVEVCVRGDESGSAYDTVELTMAFAAGYQGPICRPATVCFGPAAMPYCVEVSSGPDYDEMVVVRALGYMGPEVRAHREVLVPFQNDEAVKYTLYLDASCGTCPPDSECDDGRCGPVPWPGVFESEEWIDDVDCDPRYGQECQ